MVPGEAGYLARWASCGVLGSLASPTNGRQVIRNVRIGSVNVIYRRVGSLTWHVQRAHVGWDYLIVFGFVGSLLRALQREDSTRHGRSLSLHNVSSQRSTEGG